MRHGPRNAVSTARKGALAPTSSSSFVVASWSCFTAGATTGDRLDDEDGVSAQGPHHGHRHSRRIVAAIDGRPDGHRPHHRVESDGSPSVDTHIAADLRQNTAATPRRATCSSLNRRWSPPENAVGTSSCSADLSLSTIVGRTSAFRLNTLTLSSTRTPGPSGDAWSPTGVLGHGGLRLRDAVIGRRFGVLACRDGNGDAPCQGTQATARSVAI